MSQQLTFTWPLRVYYEDTDAQGVVYFANYLKFCERARTEWLRHLGFESSRFAQAHGLALMVVRVEAAYRGAAELDDALEIDTRLIKMGASRFVLSQNVRRGTNMLVESEVTAAVIDLASKRPARFPAPLRARFEALIWPQG